MTMFECEVTGVEKLRLPGMYRYKFSCGEPWIEVELNEKIAVFNNGDKIVVEIAESKEQCLQHEICGQGYVVSVNKLEDTYRAVISLHGPLIVLFQKNKPKSPIKTMNKVYIGISRKA